MSSILTFGTAESTSGGPDSYGYIWVDNQPPSPTVTYAWVDIVPTGTRLTLPDEGCTFEVNIGFQFRFYGTITDYLYVCSNGFVTFTVPDSFSADPPIPSTSAPNNRIVALGMDLNPAAAGSGGVFFRSEAATTPRRFVVTWDRVYDITATVQETFQIVLEQNETTKDGRILLQYKTLNGVGSPLVGIENRTGTSGLAYPKPLVDSLAVAFLPPSDAGLPPDILRVTPSTIAPAVAEAGSTDVPMLQLDLSTASNWIDVASLRVGLSGLGAGPEDVSRARLRYDNGDGILNPGSDLLIATSPFSGGTPVATLEPVSLVRVSTSLSPRLFITYDIAPDAGIDDWVGARLPDASYVSVLFPDVVSASAFPIDSYSAGVRTRITASRDTLSVANALSMMPTNVSQWDTDVPALALTLIADRNWVDLAGLTVSLGGNATAGDVWLVKALNDRDGDGAYSPGTDTVLALAAPTGPIARASLSFALEVAAGSAQRLLLLVDVAPDALVGSILNLTVTPLDFRLAPGSADVVAGTNLPVWTGDRVVLPGGRPTLQLPWLDPSPTVDGVWLNGEYPTGPGNTAALDRPVGNRLAGYVTAGNNGTALHILVDAIGDNLTDAGDGVAFGFDVDLDEAPTNNSDDVFAMNGTEGGHYLYNATAGNWTLVQPCSSATVPTCATGYGATPLERTNHRFYEFAIPLAGLGAAPGDAIRFALASPPYFGLSDGGNRSTWPLVFQPAPPLAYFGSMLLAPGPQPNRPPTLDWTGEPGYVADGLDPEWGLWNATFQWRVEYADPDGDPPAVKQPFLHVYNNGLDLAISPLSMQPFDPADVDVTDGKVYRLNFSGLPCGGNYSYSFEVRDARGLRNATGRAPGPQVICPDLPPFLSGESVSPFVGTAQQTLFTYRVVYADSEGLPPTSIELFVRRDGTVVSTPPLAIVAWVGAVGDFAAGAWFAASLVLTDPGTNYTYQFRASDGNTTVEGASVLGPYVYAPPPDVLSVSGVDLAPLFVDEGSSFVPFLGILLLTTTDVNVTAIRVDRIGNVGDAEVLAVHMYRDMDDTRTLTPGDVWVDTEQPVLGRMDFGATLRVTSGVPVSLLLLVSLARPGTPDGSVGLEVRNASYVTVGGGDVVAAFPPYRSTRSLINVPPSVAVLTVDGFSTGTAGVQHITSVSPALAWQFTDLNSADVTQIASNVSVTESPPTSPPIWFRNETGVANAVPYAGPPLADGRTYLLKVSVFDGRLWSAAAQLFFRLNTPPASPTLLAPGDFATDLDPDVTLLWQPVTDAEADVIMYTYWVSDNPGFSPSLQGSTAAPGTSLSLAAATTYYWKIGASDGFEFAGNATLWRFTTIGGGPGPVRGEVQGRVLNGSVVLPQALVELLVGDSVVTASLTDVNGTFLFRDLDLRAYTVRLSAFGFRSATRSASPTESNPVVDLGDVVLVFYTPPGDGGDGDGTIIAAIPPSLVVLLAIALALSLFVLAMSIRRRRDLPLPEESPEAGESLPEESPEAGEGKAREQAAAFECPACGRTVSLEATKCLCGAEFE